MAKSGIQYSQSKYPSKLHTCVSSLENSHGREPVVPKREETGAPAGRLTAPASIAPLGLLGGGAGIPRACARGYSQGIRQSRSRVGVCLAFVCGLAFGIWNFNAPAAAAELPSTATSSAIDSALSAAASGDPNAVNQLRQLVRQELQSNPGPQLDKLVAALQQLIALDAQKPAKLRPIQHFEDRLYLVSAVGLQQTALAAQRVLYLMEGPDEARRLAVLAEEGLREGEALRRDLDEAIEAARGDWEKLAIGLPRRLQELRDQGEYRAAWVRLYLAAALAAGRAEDAPTAQEVAILEPAVACARLHAKDEPEAQGRLSATLLCGMALWRQGKLEEARPALTAASAPAAAPRTRLQALFELARLQEQQGQWQAATQQIGEFSTLGRELLGEDPAADIDLHAAFFLNHMLSRRARLAAPSDGRLAESLEQQARQVLAEALVRNPQRLAAAAPLIGPRYAEHDVTDLQTPLALAVGLWRLEESPPDRTGAMACLAQVVARQGPQDKLFQPTALWQLGVCLYATGGEAADGGPARHRAAGYFAQLAEQFPDDPAAMAAAQNAVAILQWRLASAEGTPDAGALRDELIAALETLMGHWGDRAEFRPHALALARQYELAGRLDRALAAYGKIPSGWADHMPAWNSGLILRRRLLTEGGRRPAAGPAQVLVAEMRQFVAAARAQAQRMQSDGPAEAQKLFALAADADLRVAQVLKGELAAPAKALAHLDELESRWAASPDALQRAGALRAEILLEQGQMVRAAAILRDRHGRLGDQEETLLWRVAASARQRLGEVDLAGPAPEGTPALQAAHRQCAEQAFEIAERAGHVDYARRQMLAESWIENGRSGEAMKILQELSAQRGDDARTLQALARCHWLEGRYGDAIELYRRLSEGVSPTEQGPLWWRIQLDMARCIRDAAAGRPEPLERLGVRLRQLATMDPNMGGYRRAFDELRVGDVSSAKREDTKTTKSTKDTKRK